MTKARRRKRPPLSDAIAVGIGAVSLLLVAGTVVAAQPLVFDATPIPFRLDHRAIVVDVRIGHGKPLPFVFDSGLSNGNVLLAGTARTLGLRGEAGQRYGDTSGESHVAALTRVPELQVGRLELKDQPFAIVDTVPEGAERAGVLGAPFLQGAVVCIDYRATTLQRWLPTAFDGASLTTMPMKLVHGLPTAAAIVDGVPARLVVDTGFNGGVALFPTFAERSGLRERYPDLHEQQGTAGSGQSFGILTTVAKEVDLSQATTLNDVTLALVPQAIDPSWGIDGLMGYEVLSRLDPCLDRDGQRLMWKAPSPPAKTTAPDRSP